MKTRRIRVRVIFIGVLLGGFALLKESAAIEPGDLRAAGTVDFPVSCAPETQAEFNRGVALLHSFFYEEARRSFTAVAEKDPSCAMAQWGIAMTWWHPIWTPPRPDEMSAGKTAAAKAMAMKGGTERERLFIAALNVYYTTADRPTAAAVGQSCHGPVGPRDRVIAYEKAMRQLDERYPDDLEVETFYALAVLAVGYATPTDATLSNQLRAAGILEKLWKKHPSHPGVAHYLIHSYDYPSLAQRGLPAAKTYGSIAPWVPHALHMPSHIFTRLGMWEESIAANRSAAEAARAYAAMRKRGSSEAEELHALDYMAYSYLQEGQDSEAKKIVDSTATVRTTYPAREFSAAYALAAIPARYALERSAWAEAAALPVPALPHWSSFPFMEGLLEYTHALGRAHLGDLDGARAALARMRQLYEATTEAKFDFFKRHLDLQMQAATAWITYREGKKDEAVDLLRRAANAEDLLGKHPVSPGPLVPIREQLGRLLLELDRPQEAKKEFEASLKISPGRLQAIAGAGEAAERSQSKEIAAQYYTKLVAQAAKADGARDEIIHARAFLAASAPAASK